ncbi:MAG TPA: GAF domain-containing protein [Thermodesulfobacteriota bacterium]|nr:GAF domain-containing protein [Thermodesulfobacteriota bacterium]
MSGKDSQQGYIAFIQVSSAIKSQKDISSIFEIIGRESARCLKAQRSTVFLANGEKDGLKIQFSYSPDSINDEVGSPQEKEVARRAIAEQRPILLKEPKDFSEFFKSDQRGITSLLSIPFGLPDRSIGSLNVSLMNGKRAFNEKDLQFLSIFANYASIAVQNQYMLNELRNAAGLRKSYERHLDDLLGQLQSLSGEDRRRIIEDHIGKLLSGKRSEMVSGTKSIGKAAAGKKEIIRLTGEASFEGSSQNLTEKIQVEIESSGDDLSRCGVFIPTENPKDLGEQFLLRLHSPKGDPVEVACKVIFSNKYGKATRNLTRGMGVKFLDLSPEVQKKLEEYVQACK